MALHFSISQSTSCPGIRMVCGHPIRSCALLTGRQVTGLRMAQMPVSSGGQSSASAQDAEDVIQAIVREEDIAASLMDTGQHAEALRRLLKVEESVWRLLVNGRSLGVTGPDFDELEAQCVSIHDALISCMEDMGSMAETQEPIHFIREALEKSDQGFGEEHVVSINLNSHLGQCLREMGQLDEALRILRKNVEVSASTLEESDPLDLFTKQCLASCLVRMGLRSEALPLLRQVEGAAWGVLVADPGAKGSMDLYLSVYEGMMRCLENLGRLPEALQTVRVGAARSAHALGAEHIVSIKQQLILCTSLGNMGAHAEALAVGTAAVEAAERTLGEDDPDTVDAQAMIATVLCNLDRRGEVLCRFPSSLKPIKPL